MPDSNILLLVLKIGLGALALFNMYVSIRLILFSGYTAFQKAWQLAIIWLIPILGAVFIHSLIVVPRWVKPDSKFTEDGGDNPPGIGLG